MLFAPCSAVQLHWPFSSWTTSGSWLHLRPSGLFCCRPVSLLPMILMTKIWVLGSQPNGHLLREVFLSVFFNCLLLCHTDAPIPLSVFFSLKMWTYWEFTYMEVATFSKKKNKETFMKTVSWSFPGNFTMCYVLFLCHLSYLNVVKLYWEYGQCLVTAWEKKTYKKPSISVFFVWKILNHILRQLSWHLLCPSGSFSQETMYMLNESPCLSVDQIALCEPWEAVRPHCLSLIFAISCLIQGILRVGSHGLAHFWIQQLWLVAVWNLWKDRTRKWPRHPGFVLWVACIWFKL